MKFWQAFFIGYLGFGVLFQIVQHMSLNLFRLSTWANIVLWLPLVVFHFIWGMIVLAIIGGMCVWLLTLAYPGFRRSLTQLWRKTVHSTGMRQ